MNPVQSFKPLSSAPFPGLPGILGCWMPLFSLFLPTPHSAVWLPIALLCPPPRVAVHSHSLFWPCEWHSVSLPLLPPVAIFLVFGMSTAYHLPLSFVPKCLPPELVPVLYTIPQHQACSLPDAHHRLVFNCWLCALNFIPRGQEKRLTHYGLPRPSLWRYLCNNERNGCLAPRSYLALISRTNPLPDKHHHLYKSRCKA